MSTSSISKNDLRKNIYQQIIGTDKIYYSFVNKSQQTLSIMKNQRFLIFNQTKGYLFYVNDPKSVPFITAIPQPKNNVIADMNLVSMIKLVSGNEFNIQFTIMNKDNKPQTSQWNFITDINQLSAGWVRLLQEYKQVRKRSLEEQAIKMNKDRQNGNKQQIVKQTNNNSNSNVNNNLLNYNKVDDLGYTKGGNVSESKASNQQPPLGYSNVGNNTQQPQIPNYGKTEQQQQHKDTINNNISKPQPSYITNNPNPFYDSKPITYDSKPQSLGDSKQKPIPPSITISQPPSKPQLIESNIINNDNNPSRINDNPSRASLFNTQPNAASNNRYQQGSLQKKSQPSQSNNNSRLTFKDQIQSIIGKNSKLSIEGQSNLNEGNNSNIRQSTKQAYKREKDWNWRFYSNPSQQVIYEFQQHAINSVTNILKQDRTSNQQLRVYLQPQSIVIVTDFGSVEAKKIKSQFRNYHFIMEALKGEEYGRIICVPLTCLIQYQGLVIMVKSLIPEHAPKVECTQQLMLQIKELQRYTRVKNGILKKSTLYDLSNIYETTGKRLLFINQLIEYLPAHTDELFYGSLLRPEHMLDNVNQFMHGGLGYEAMRQDIKAFDLTIDSIKNNTIQLAKAISCGDIKFTNGEELKNILHQEGINLKYLPLLYNEITNKQIKKYIHSFMVAKIAKQDILSSIVSTRSDRMKLTVKPQLHVKQLVQKSIKLLVDGNSNVSNELWKEMALSFRKQYGFQMSNSDIHGPFFINSLMKLLKIKYDLRKLNMNKVMFKDDHIIGDGFVVDVGMKVKSYYRWMTKDVEELMHVCKGQKRDEIEFMGVCEMLELKKRGMPKFLQTCRITPFLQEYLSSFIPPPQFETHEFKHLSLYNSISLEPPTAHSLATTLNYLKWCLEYDHIEEFKLAIDEALQLIDVWLGQQQQGQQKGSFYHCEFYQLLSEFYYKQENVDDSVNFLKESLATMIRNNGLGSKRIATGYYMLGEREMKLGRWSQALENFLKAKQSMQASGSTAHINYPKSLLKLSQLYLQSTQFQQALVCAKQSIQQFQKQQSLSPSSNSHVLPYPKQTYDEYCIKAIQIMCRVFEIEGKKNELHRIAQMTAAKYNRTKSPHVYEQIVKISLISIVNKISIEKCKLFLGLIEKVIITEHVSTINSQQKGNSSVEQLMQMSSQYNVMQRFMIKFENLERIVVDINGKRSMGSDTKEFINMLRPIVYLVGEEFIMGLVEQREIEE